MAVRITEALQSEEKHNAPSDERVNNGAIVCRRFGTKVPDC